MSNTNIKVGIVEDKMIIAQSIAKTLRELGYTPCEPAVSYSEAMEMIERDKPDILLLDIILSGHKDGIDVAMKVKEDYDIPFIFLTANSDAATVERAKKAAPPAYLVKPFNKEDLYTSIEICLHNFSERKRGKVEIEKGNYVINNFLFIKQAQNFVKVKVEDITYIESDHVYITVHTTTNKFLVRSNIQNYMDLIDSKNLVRVHRSYAVNILHLDAINQDGLSVNGQDIPVGGKAYKDELMSILKIG